MKLLVLNGPNLNLLGLREPALYGHETYADLVRYVTFTCEELSFECECFQSNHEGALVDKIQSAYGVFDAIIINPAAYTHTSIAILDALKAVALPAIEVHLTDVSSREDFRKISYPSLYCLKTFAGLGFLGYKEAALFLKNYFEQKKEAQKSDL